MDRIAVLRAQISLTEYREKRLYTRAIEQKQARDSYPEKSPRWFHWNYHMRLTFIEREVWQLRLIRLTIQLNSLLPKREKPAVRYL